MLISQEYKLNGLVLMLIYIRFANSTRLGCIWSFERNLTKSSNGEILQALHFAFVILFTILFGIKERLLKP